MSWLKLSVLILTLGLVALLAVPVMADEHESMAEYFKALAGASGTVIIRDSDDAKYSSQLSNMATMTLTGVPQPRADTIYEGWLVADDGSIKQSTGTFVPDANGNVTQTFWMPGGAGTVELRTRPDWGWYLTDSNGMTVYSFSVDDQGSGTSKCTGGCADFWPPLTISSGQPMAGMGVNPTLLGTITRDDGSTQVTYNGWPLYYFLRDGAPGDTTGRYTTWWSMSPDGMPIMESALALMLNEQNDSGQSGGAMLTAKDGGTEVMLQLSAGAMETTAVHIHFGRCGIPDLGGVAHTLASFAGGAGTSTTMLDGVTLDSLMNGDFAINSHNSDDPSIYTACTDIPKLSDSMTVPLDEQNDSGQSGWATVTSRGDDTEVVLWISPGTMETEAVHIHAGACGTDLGGVARSLTSFVGGSGTSATLVAGVTLSDLNAGTFAINSHNSDDPSVYTTCGSVSVPGAIVPTAENLFASFDKFVVTVEPVVDPDPLPAMEKAFFHQIPKGGIIHIRHLAYSWQGNPAYTSGPHAGEPKGISVGLREQAWVALVHIRLAMDQTTLAAIQRHAEHVVNAIEGTGDLGGPNYGDLNKDGNVEDFGDGFGVLNYAADAAKHARFAAGATQGDTVIEMHSKAVVAASDSVAVWADLTRKLALEALGSDSLTAATLLVKNAEAIMEKAWDSAKQAYWSSQNMGTYTLAPVIPPPAEPKPEPKPPDTGDPIVPNLALMALLAGVLLLVSGGYIWLRLRSQA